jgi:formate hydrogenlyase subunit 4
MIELAAALRLLIWMSLIAVIFAPFCIAPRDADGASLAPWLWAWGIAAWTAKIAAMSLALAIFETTRAKLRVFRVPEMLGMALLLGLLAAIFLFVSQGFA